MGIVGLPPMTNRLVTIAPTIVAASNAAPIAETLGINSKIAEVTSRPPVKYRNH